MFVEEFNLLNDRRDHKESLNTKRRLGETISDISSSQRAAGCRYDALDTHMK